MKYCHQLIRIAWVFLQITAFIALGHWVWVYGRTNLDALRSKPSSGPKDKKVYPYIPPPPKFIYVEVPQQPIRETVYVEVPQQTDSASDYFRQQKQDRLEQEKLNELRRQNELLEESNRYQKYGY